MQEWGIKTRVLFLTLVPTIVISVVLAVYFTQARLQDLENALRDRGYAIALQLAPASEYGVFSGNMPALQRISNRALDEPEVRAVSIFNKEGHLLTHAGRKIELPNHIRSINNPTNGITMADTGNSLLFTVPITMRDAMIDDYPDSLQQEKDILAYAHSQDNVIGWITIEVGRMTTQLRQYHVLFACSLIFLFGLGISGMVAFRLARDVTQPILSLTHAVEKIKDGNLDTRIYTGARAEIGRLEAGINTMAASLKTAHDELHSNIEQATADLRQTLETIEIQNIQLEIARKEAETASKVKSAFLANMSHEIRTPLNGILGFINLLVKTEMNARQTEYLSTIQKSATSLLSIINDILDFSKMEAGKLYLDYARMDLRECVEDALTLMAPTAHAKGLELVPMMYSDVPTHIMGDTLRIKQVITNLVNNAIKFTQKGHVIIRVMLEKESLDGLMLCVSVTDTGIGLSPEEQHQLFQAFKQADPSTSRKYGGTGLGLVISKQLVQAMQGDIGVESQHNKGSTFWFTFNTERVEEEDKPVFEALRGFHVLLYDATPISRLAICHLLESWGMTVNSTDTLEKFIGKLHKKPLVDLVLLGTNQPDLPNDPILDFIKQTRAIIDSPIGLLINTTDGALHHSLVQQYQVQFTLVKPTRCKKMYDTLCQTLLPADMIAYPLNTSSPLERLTHDEAVIHVLTVDDYQPNLKLVRALLEDMNIRVTTATSAAEALETLKITRFDLILMDIQMPIMDGVEATYHIRKMEPSHYHTPIIALTAHVALQEREQLLSSGLDDYLTKPINERELQALIYRWVKRAQPPELRVSHHLPTEAPMLVSTEAIDWALGIRRAGGNADLAKEMLGGLVKTLTQEKAAINQALARKDFSQLRELVHRLHGACCYCGVPHLQEATAQLESSLHNADIQQIEQGVDYLNTEIERILHLTIA